MLSKIWPEPLNGSCTNSASIHRTRAYRSPQKHGIGPPMLESPRASQKFIRDGVDYFVRSRSADAISLDTISVILETTGALKTINSGIASEKNPIILYRHTLNTDIGQQIGFPLQPQHKARCVIVQLKPRITIEVRVQIFFGA